MLPIAPFQLERYFARHEFSARYLLCPSDCESLSMKELLVLADDECRRLWEGLHLGYTESAGHPLVRAEIAGLYEHIKADRIVTFAPEEAILVAMSTLLEAGDEVIALSPAYQSLHEIARSLGAVVKPWRLAPTANGWELDYDWLEKAVSPQTRMVVINFPHNPTGFLPERAGLERIAATVDRHGLILFGDEMYRGLEYSPSQRLPAVCDLTPHGISLGGLSKTYALPGLRTGWLASQDTALPSRWLRLKDYITICGSAPGEILALIALRSHEQLAARSREIVQANLAKAGVFFALHEKTLRWLAPQAGSVCFPELLEGGPIEDFCERLVAQKSVMLAPGNLFAYPGNHFRMGLGRKNFSEALKKLGEFLDE